MQVQQSSEALGGTPAAGRVEVAVGLFSALRRLPAEVPDCKVLLVDLPDESEARRGRIAACRRDSEHAWLEYSKQRNEQALHLLEVP